MSYTISIFPISVVTWIFPHFRCPSVVSASVVTLWLFKLQLACYCYIFYTLLFYIYYLLSVVFANLLAINDFVCITRLSQFHLLISLFVFNSLSIVNSSAPGTKSNLRLIPVRIVYEFRSIVCVCV